MRSKSLASTQNPLVKSTARLRDRGGREAQGRIVIDGARELKLALESGIALESVFVCRSLCHTQASQELLVQLEQGSPAVEQVIEVTPAVFGKLAYGDRAEGVLGVAHTPRRTLNELELPAGALVGVVEGVEKPGNLGAVLRSADAAGVSALVAADCRIDLYNPNAIRASLGTIFTMRVCAAPTDGVLAWLRDRGTKVFAARTDASTLYTDADFRGAAAIVLGSEASGLSAAWMATDVAPIRLPMRGTADSLNVSAAAAVLFYEALRQRS
jgi:TrmH family RNA methyltransferase